MNKTSNKYCFTNCKFRVCKQVENSNELLSSEISYANSFKNLAGLCKFFQPWSLVGGVGGFLYFKCEDDILKKSAKKI